MENARPLGDQGPDACEPAGIERHGAVAAMAERAAKAEQIGLQSNEARHVMRLQRAGWSVNRTRKALMVFSACLSPIAILAVYTHSVFWTSPM